MDAPFPAPLLPAWRALLARREALTLDPESGVCEAVFADPVLFPLQRKAELRAMLAEARAVGPRVVVEIGADKGGGLLHWCLLPSVRHVAACEIRGTPYAGVFEAAFPHIDFLWLPTGSRAPEAKLRLADWLRAGRIDALFIDGDKLSMLADFDAYLPYMAPSGVAFLHDVSDSRGPAEAFAEVQRRGRRTKLIHDQSESWRAMAREDQGLPPADQHEAWCRWWRGKSCGVGVVYMDGRAAG